jgi:hypothetical protein
MAHVKTAIRSTNLNAYLGALEMGLLLLGWVRDIGNAKVQRDLNSYFKKAQSGKDRLLTGPPHTTHHAGPQWAVQRVDALD